MAHGTEHIIFHARGTGTSKAIVQIRLKYSKFGPYMVAAYARQQNFSWKRTNWFTISGDDWHGLEVDWQAASSDTAHDGRVTFWIDGVQVDEITNLDTRHIDSARLGATQGIDATTQGAYYLDAFESRRPDDD